MRLTTADMANKYNINRSTVRKWIKSGLLTPQDNYKPGQPYSLDEEEFLKVKRLYWSDSCKRSYEVGWNREVFKTIDTPEKAYWLGFILADGCLHLTKKR